MDRSNQAKAEAGEEVVLLPVAFVGGGCAIAKSNKGSVQRVKH
jgi:hypothetical protein